MDMGVGGGNAEKEISGCGGNFQPSQQFIQGMGGGGREKNVYLVQNPTL